MGSDILYYIQETDKPNFFLNLFNIVKLQNDNIILPICGDSDITYKKALILAKKINYILNKTNCRTVLISKKMKQKQQFINFLYSYNLNIIDSKWLFEVLAEKSLNYIIDKKKIKKQEMHLSILVNDPSEITLETINKLVRQYKRVNIVTNHIEKFKKIEEKMLEEEGITLIVNNNKRKSLLKSELILNIDFPTELINQYRIYYEAIIINVKEKIKINKKRFNGININDYEIKFGNIEEIDYEKFEKFYKKDIYEAKTYKKQPYEDIIRKIKRDKVEIAQLKSENTTF